MKALLFRVIFLAAATLSVARADAADRFIIGPANIPVIVYDPKGPKLDSIAATLLANDIFNATGLRAPVRTSLPTGRGNFILIGNAQSSLLQQSAPGEKAFFSSLRGKWECYGRKVIAEPKAGRNTLIIAGSDPRGTAYGVFTLSEELGISPWYWWADVKPKKLTAFSLLIEPGISAEPSVKFRGIFLNDEDWGLQPWAAKTFEPETGDIGPKTYAKIFELLLRLKANLIWPAMHPSTKAFYSIPGNDKVAADYRIVVGSSHAEPMLRNNVGEWNEKTMGAFNYLTNKDKVFAYWESRAKESAGNDAIYTIGMRGVHDSGIEGVKTAREAVPLLERIFEDQRNLLRKYRGDDIRKIPQVFTAYKEVLDIYDLGLKVPDDVTLVWPDDNYGYIQRLNNDDEKKRGGGSGVYYHASYWGRPHDYLWLSSTNPALIREEMMKAYGNDSKTLWVLNVGDIKPLEYNIQLFMDMAYRAEPFKLPAYVYTHMNRFASGIFGQAQGPAIASVWKEYYRLAFERRPEFMGWSQTEPTTQTKYTEYNHSDYGDEAQRRIDAYDRIASRVKALRKTTTQPDAFYELVYYPVTGAAWMNKKFLFRDKAWILAAKDPAKSGEYARQSKLAYDSIRLETDFYNTKLAAGKWKGVISMEPRGLPVYKEPVIEKPDASKPEASPANPSGRVLFYAEASNYSRLRGTGWQKIEGLNQSSFPALAGPGGQPAENTTVEYDFQSDNSKEMTFLVYTLPSLPLNNRSGMRYRVSVDDGPAQVIDFKTVGRTEEWKQNVLRNSAIKSFTSQSLTPGKHTLKLTPLDPGIVFQRIVSYAEGSRRAYSPLPETFANKK